MLSYENNGFEANLSHAVLGSGNFTHSRETADLKQPWAEFQLIAGYVDEANQCMNFTIMGQVENVINVSEIGIYDTSGQLFAVSALPSGCYFKTIANGFFTFSISIAIEQKIAGKKIKLAFAPQEQILTALLALHLQHYNPHPQYIKYMRNIIQAHIAEADPHPQYSTKEAAEQMIQEYVGRVGKIIELLMTLLGDFGYSDYISASSSNDIAISGFEGNLTQDDQVVFLCPEGQHEGWAVTRRATGFNANIFDRSGTNRSAYTGPLNWLVLPDMLSQPIVKTIIPELRMMGVGTGNAITVAKPKTETYDMREAVILISPEGQHERWTIERTADAFTASVFNRSGVGNLAYTGKVDYLVLDKKQGTDLPLAFPSLLMSGVSDLGDFSIPCPAGKKWDFSNPSYVLMLTPEGAHEGWTAERSTSEIKVSVFNRTGQDRVKYSGRVNWAIFMKSEQQLRNIYRKGIHQISLDAGQVAIVELFGAGAGAGGSIYTPVTESADGTDGESTVFKTSKKNIIAGGGKKGIGGWWGNGSHMDEGRGGDGGKNTVSILERDNFNVSIESSADGKAGGINRWSPQFRAQGFTALGYSDSNYGGAGGWGIGDESRSGGGSGGAGGYIRFRVKNESSEPVSFEVIAGAAGKGWNKYHNAGEDGGDGFAIVTFL